MHAQIESKISQNEQNLKTTLYTRLCGFMMPHRRQYDVLRRHVSTRALLIKPEAEAYLFVAVNRGRFVPVSC